MTSRVGCLGGCLGIVIRCLLVLVVFGLGVTYAIYWLLAPWNFYAGGHFHWLPGWQGEGTLHSTAAGGDYFLWMGLTFNTPALQKSPLKGMAYLCTPRGERLRLRFTGAMPRDHGTDLTGVPLRFYLDHRPIFWEINSDRRPALQFLGSFADSQLVLDDQGSLAKAFRPDGTLYAPSDRTHRLVETVRFALKESPHWVRGPQCPTTAAASPQ